MKVVIAGPHGTRSARRLRVRPARWATGYEAQEHRFDWRGRVEVMP